MKTDLSAPPRFARVYGSPGTRVRMLGLGKSLWPLMLTLPGVGWLIRAAVPVPALSSALTGVLFFILAIAVAAAANYSRVRLQNFLKGARGEESVARVLARLPAGFDVFHGLAAGRGLRVAPGGADLDHVVIAPGDVFAIETKNWQGRITLVSDQLRCDDQLPDRDPLAQAKAAAGTLHRLLATIAGPPLPVTPVLCFAGGELEEPLTVRNGIVICNEDRLERIMLRPSAARLPAEQRRAAVRLLMQSLE